MWICGSAGTYKTSYVQKKYPDFFEKDKSKYWNGYTGQETVLIDDIEKDEKYMLGHLKRWA